MNFVGKFDGSLPVDGPGAHAHVETFSQQATHAPPDAIIVPDANLLFTGDFKRSGVDLVLSKDHHELVLHDYFKGEKRAALSSPDGAHLTGDLVNALTGHVEYAQADGNAGASHVIGHVSKLTGSATAVRNGVSIILNNGDNVEKGDVVQAGSDSALGITFIDGTVFGLSSNARMVLNEMVYDPNGSNNSSLLSLVAGTISFVAGETAKHGDMKIDTPVATMGIRGTAGLVEIDFDVSIAATTNAATTTHFHVLVEPDGTTGSYILFDKTTLTPIATVNQAGQQINISQGNVSITNSPLTDAQQKLITDVFAQKFTDNTNSNTKTASSSTGSSTPDNQQIQVAHQGDDSNKTGAPTVTVTVTASNDKGAGPPPPPLGHVPGAPEVSPFGGALREIPGTTNDKIDKDTISGPIFFTDPNKGDAPTATVTIDKDAFTYRDAHGNDITAQVKANAQWLADVKAVEVDLNLTPDPGNTNNGFYTWKYSVKDAAFDFLAAGETLTLTYVAHVNNNFALNPEIGQTSFTITITGTNDVPVITTGPESVAFQGGKNTVGGNLQTVGGVPTTGTLAFTDVDLSDTHTVATQLTNASMSGPGAATLDMAALDQLAPTPMAAFEKALTAKILAGNDSTGTGGGTISWQLADLPVYFADFIPVGEKLTLTYTVTVTDSQHTTATQTVTVTIAGLDTAAVVWIDTKPAPESGALWSDASNWETGTVPTATDDAIIITDQLSGNKPTYPVTINAPAVAKTVTMNDFGSTAPELDNNSTLTIGGTFDLIKDSIVVNSATGTIGVGGAMEVLGASVLKNYGTLDLQQGGDFKDTSTITNYGSGIIDVTGGTLNVLVDIANHGHIAVESSATLTLNGSTVTGGSITNLGTIDVTGTSAIDGDNLTNTDGIIHVTSGKTLTLDGSTVTGGTINDDGTVKVTTTLTLDDVTVTGGAITDDGTITVDSGQTLSLAGVALTGGAITSAGTVHVTADGSIKNDQFGNHQLTIDTGKTLTLDGTTVTGGAITSAGTVHVTADSSIKNDQFGNTQLTIDTGKTLTLDGTTVTGGAITSAGTVHVTADGSIKNDQFGNHQLTIDTGKTLTLDGTTVTGGAITDNGTVNVSDSGQTLTLSGVALTGGAITSAGTVHVTADGSIKNDQFGNHQLTIDTGKTLTLDGTTVTGGAITDNGTVNVSDSGQTLTLAGVALTGGAIISAGTVHVTADGSIKNDQFGNTQLTIDTGKTLTLDGTTVTGGAITDNGTVNVSGSSQTLTLNGVALTGGAITSAGTVHVTADGSIKNDQFGNTQLTIDTGKTLTLDGTTVTGGAITDNGTVNVSGSSQTLTLSGVALTGGAITSAGTVHVTADGSIKNDQFGNTQLTIDTGKTLTLDGTTVTGGAITDNGTVNVSGSSQTLTLNGVALTGGAITSAGTVHVTADGSIKNDQFGNTQLTIDTGKTLTLDGTTVTGGAITDNGTVNVGSGQALTLNGVALTGGAITSAGTVHVTADGSIKNDQFGNTQLTIDTGKTLTLDGTTVTGGAITDNGTVNVSGSSQTLTLNGVALTGGAITSAGTVHVTADGSIKNDQFGNTQLTIDSGKTLTLDGTTVTGGAITDNGTVNVSGSSQTLTLSGVALTGGAITSAGTVHVTADGSIKNDQFGNTQLTIDTGKTLTLDGTTVTGGAITDNGTVNVSGSSQTLTLSGVALTGGAITSAGTVHVTADGSIKNDQFGNTQLTIDTGKTLTLDGTTVTGGAITSAGTVHVTADGSIKNDQFGNTQLTIDTGKTLTLDGTTVTGGAITDNGTVNVGSGQALTLNGVALTGGAITSAGTVHVTADSSIKNDQFGNHQLTIDTGKTLTLDGTTVTGGAITDNGTVNVSGSSQTLTLSGVALTGGAITSAGTVHVTADGSIKNDQFGNTQLTIDTGKTLTLDGTTVTGGAITDNGTVNVGSGQALTLNGVALTGGAITSAGTVHVTADGSIKNDQFGNTQLTIDTGKTLTLNGVALTGGAITSAGTVHVTADGSIKNDQFGNTQLTIDTGKTLTLDGTTVTGGAITDNGTVNVSGSSQTLTLNGVALTGGAITSAGTVHVTADGSIKNDQFGNTQLTIDSGKTLTLDGTTVTGGAITDNGTVNVSGSSQTLTLSGVALTGGAITSAGTVHVTADGSIKNDQFGNTQLTIDTGKTLTLDGTTVTGGAITDNGTVNVSGSSQTLTLNGVALTGGAITSAGTVHVTADGSIKNDQFGNTQLTIDTGKTLTLDGTTVTGGAITDNGTVNVSGSSQTLTLSGVALTGGAITSAGTVHVTADGSIKNDQFGNAQLTIDTGKTLTLDGTTVTGGAITDNGTVNVGSGQALTLNGVALTGGAITSAGTVHVTADGSIKNDQFGNTQLTIDTGKTLTLDGTTVTGGAITDNGTVNVSGSSQTLTLNGVALTGGAITSAGTVHVTADGSIKNDQFGNTQLTVDSGKTLTLDGTTVTGGAITDNGTVNVGSGTLGLDNVTITGGTLGGAGTIDVISSSRIQGTTAVNAALNTANVTVESGQTLKLDDVTVTGTTFTDPGTIKVETGNTLTLAGTDTITGGQFAFGEGKVALVNGGGIRLSGVSIGNLKATDPQVTLTISATNASSLAIAGGVSQSNGTVQVTGALSAVIADLASGLTFNPLGASTVLTMTIVDTLGDTAFRTLTVATPQTGSPSFQVTDASGAIRNANLIDVASNAIVTLSSDQVFNGPGTLQVEAGGLLKLSHTGTHGGVITDNGTIEITGHSGFNGGNLNIDVNGFLTVDSTKLLTLNNMTVTGGTVTDGTTTSGGTIEIIGSSAINGVYLNYGAVTVDSGQILTLDGSTVTGTAITGTDATSIVHVDDGQTLTLNGATITGGTINDGTATGTVVGISTVFGDIDVTGNSTIKNASLNYGDLKIDQGITLTLDKVAVTGTSIEVDGAVSSITPGNLILQSGTTVSGSQLTIDAGDQLTMNGATISGGTTTDKGLIDVTASSTINGNLGLSSGQIKVEDNATLTLGNALAIGTNTVTLVGANAILILKDAAGLSLAGGTISGLGKLAADTNLSGYGTVSISLDTADLVTANAGTLDFTSAVDSTTSTSFHIAAAANSVLKFDAAVGTASIHPTVTFEGVDNGAGVLDLTAISLANSTVTSLPYFHSVIANFDEGEAIDVHNAASALLDSTGKILTVYDSSHTSLGTIDFATSYAGDTFNVSANGAITVDDLAVTLDSATATQGTAINVTAVTDDAASIIANVNVKYSWQVSTSADGHTGWTEVGSAASYRPTEADEGQYLQLVVTNASDPTSNEVTTKSLGLVGESASNDLLVTLDSQTAAQDSTITVTGVTDGLAVASGVTYSWQVSTYADGHTGWTEVGSAASYRPTEADEGQYLQLVVTNASDPTSNEVTTKSLGLVGESASNDLLVTLDSQTAAQDSTITVTGVTDGLAVASGVTYSWQVSTYADGHTGWTEVGSAASYRPTEADEGQYLQLVVTNASDPTSNEVTTKSLGLVGESASNDLLVTLDSQTAAQDSTITVTGVTDGLAVASGVTYSWQVSTSADGHTGWTEVGSAASYRPTEANEGQYLQLVVTNASDPTSNEVTTKSLGLVGESASNDLVTTLNATSAAEGAQITVAGVTDGLTAVTTGLTYSWQILDSQGHWNEVGTNSFYAPSEADQGKSLQLVTTYADQPSGNSEKTINSFGTVADIAPVLTAPFSYSLDELKIVKNDVLALDDTFSSQAPLAGTTFGGTPVGFSTLGSTWTEVGGKAVMSSAGAVALPLPGIGTQVIARLLTNTQDQAVSSAGLKENSTFTASTTFDLVTPPNSGDLYGFDLNDATATHPNDEMVQLYVQRTATGGAIVKLVQANFSLQSFPTIASYTLTASDLQNYDQIRLDLAHLTAGTSDITGSFELLNSVTHTFTTHTFGATGHVFNNVTYTRVDILAFAPQGVTITGTVTEGQTLTAHTSTNDSDASIHYQWQSFGNGTWNNVGIDSSQYLLGEADEGHLIRVMATTLDANNASTASVTSNATVTPVTPLVDAPAVTASVTPINEDGTSALTLTLTNADNNLFVNGDDSVTVTVTLDHGATLSRTGTGAAVTNNGNGTFTLIATSASDLNGLIITPAGEYEGNVAVGVSALIHDGTTDSTTTIAAPTTLTVNPVADAPVLSGLHVKSVSDSLTGTTTIDATKWHVYVPPNIIPGADDASVTATANGVVLHDHGYLQTVAGFTPTAATPLHVTLSFMMTTPSDYVDVTVGATGAINVFGSPADGIEFVSHGTGGISIFDHATGLSQPVSGNFNQNVHYDVGIVDDGSNQTFVVTNDANGQVVASATSHFASPEAGNLVTISNRESLDHTHDATIKDVAISNAYRDVQEGTVTLTGLTALTDTDSSDSLSLALSGFPVGAKFSAGALGDSGLWVISAADLASLGATPLTMTAPAGYSGSFTLHVASTVTDTAIGATSGTQTFGSDVAVTIGPEALNSSVVTDIGQPRTFAASDFHFTDVTANPESLQAITITGLPTGGTLKLQLPGTFATDVQVNDTIQAADIGYLIYTPAPEAVGTDTFQFTVQDSGGAAGGGHDTSANTATMSIIVKANDAPVAVDSFAVTDLSHAHTFAASDFHFTDITDSTEPLKAITITGMPSNGTLKLMLPGTFGVAVQPNMTIQASDIGYLVYTPGTFPPTGGTDSFQFKVQDSGGTALINGNPVGQDTSVNIATMKINVKANDAPVAVDSFAVTDLSHAHTFAASDFHFTDITDSTEPLKAITITGMPSNGTLKLMLPGTFGVAVQPNMTIQASDIGYLVYTPGTFPPTGGTDSFQFKVQDSGGTALINGNPVGQDTSVNIATMKINVKANDAPVAVDSFAVTDLSHAHTFAASDFHFTDITDSTEPLKAITITGMPSNGTLKLMLPGTFGVAVQPNMTIQASDIGYLVYTPGTFPPTGGTDSFQFKVQDSGGTALINGNPVGQDTSVNIATMKINVKANDAPVAVDSFAVTDLSHAHTFAASDFHFTDITDSTEPLKAITITGMPSNGTLKLMLPGTFGVAVQPNMTIQASDIGYLVYTPGTFPPTGGTDSFQFKVQDSGGTALINGNPVGQDTSVNIATMKINVKANDAPVAVDSFAVTDLSHAHTFAASDFHFTDITDSTEPLKSITITGMPSNGTLKLMLPGTFGVDVQPNMTIQASDIGYLVYTPGTFPPTGGTDSFQFKVQDSGGTALINGNPVGQDTSVNIATMKINVKANDAPVAVDSFAVTDLSHAHTFAVSDFHFTDITDSTEPLKSITITGMPSNGTLKLMLPGTTGTDVHPGDTIQSSNIGYLVYTPGTFPPTGGTDSFQFKVQDSGGTALINGNPVGQDTSVNIATMKINVKANDAPVAVDSFAVTDLSHAHTFAASDFHFTDITDSTEPLKAITITGMPSNGTLKLMLPGTFGVDVQPNMTIQASDIGYLVYTPGTFPPTGGTDSFQFKVQDSGGTALINGNPVGQDTSVNIATMKINVKANDAPVAVDSFAVTDLSHAHTFAASDFHFTDITDSTEPLKAITITGMPSNGTLKLMLPGTFGVAVQPNMTIQASDIGYLVYTPGTFPPTGGTDSFQFKVQDSGGTALINGNPVGQDTSVNIATMKINVKANDAPVAVDSFAVTDLSHAHTFAASDFHFTDITDSTEPLKAITITGMPSNGTLKLMLPGTFGVAVQPNMTIQASDIGYLVYTPGTFPPTGGTDSFQFKVQDSGGTALINGNPVGQDTSVNIATMKINVKANDAPVAVDSFAVTDLSHAHTFAASDFHFTDITDSTEPLKAITITGMPSNGTLKLMLPGTFGVAVQPNMTIQASDIGYLVYTPGTFPPTGGTDSFQFKVQDSGGTALINGNPVGQDTSVNIATMKINVKANDAPVAVDSFAVTDLSHAHTFAASDFHFTDITDSTEPLKAITITGMPSNGTLKLMLPGATGTDVHSGDTIQGSDIGYLVYTPTGTSTGTDSFQFKVQDSGGTALINGNPVGQDTSVNVATMSINVKPNDAPVAVDSKAVTDLGHAHTFAVSDFHFTDITDSTEPLKSITITGMPSNGTLKLMLPGTTGTDVHPGDTIQSSNIGYLVYTPGTFPPTGGTDSFQFKVQDSGGTALINGNPVGQDTSVNVATMKINVKANDAPVAVDSFAVTDLSHAHTFAASDFHFTDITDAAEPLKAIIITSLPDPTKGVLNLVLPGTSGTPVVAGDTIQASNIGYLVYTPVPGAVVGPDSFQFQVQDSGGTVQGGTDISNTATMSITLQASVAPVPSGYLWGTSVIPEPNAIHFNSISNFNANINTGAALFATSPSNGFVPGGPDAITENVSLFDPFGLPYRSGIQPVQTSTTQFPFKYSVLMPVVATTGSPPTASEAIAFYTTETNGASTIYQKIISEGIGSNGSTPNGTLTVGPATALEQNLTGAVTSLFSTYTNVNSATPSTMTSYAIAWSVYDGSNYQANFQIFPTGGPATAVKTIESLTNVGAANSTPAWQFRNAGGPSDRGSSVPYASVIAQADGTHFGQQDIKFQGYNIDGTANADVTYLIAPDLTHFQPGATNQITQPSNGASLLFTPNGVPGSGFSAGWSETVNDSNGTHQQVEFAIFKSSGFSSSNVFGSGTLISQTTFQVPDAQNIRVGSFASGGASFEYLAYGDATSTTVVEFDQTGHQIASFTDTAHHGVTYSDFAVMGDGRIALSYPDSAQYTTDIIDLRQSGLNNPVLSTSGPNFIAGTQYADTVTGANGVNGVNNFYEFVGASGTPHTDSFTGGTSGIGKINEALFAGARSNFTISLNGVTATVQSGDSTHAGTLITSNVQALAFGASQDQNPTSTGGLEVTGGETLVMLGNFAVGNTYPVKIDAGGTLEIMASSSVEAATFNGAATLQLDKSQSYTGAIAVFGAGDTIDLADVTYASNEHALWTQTTTTNGGSGTLEIYDGANALQATLQLNGIYAQNEFALADDNTLSHGTAVKSTDLAITTSATAPTFTTFDVPGATSTYAFGINNSGQIVGQESTSGQEFGWRYDGSFHSIQEGSAHNTSAGAINDSGVVTGYYEPVSSTPRYGFTLTGSTFTTIDHSPFSHGSGNDSTTVDGINNAGVTTGAVYLGGNSYEGFIDNNGTVTILQDAASVSSITRPHGINNAGDVVGSYDNLHAFLYHNGTYTTVDDPSGVNGTLAQGVNDYGQIVGYHNDAGGKTHGYVDIGGIFTTVDDPLGTNGTVLTGINNSDQVVGYYIDASGNVHGFEASLNETSTAENSPLVLTALNVSDPAAGTNPIQVSLAVGHGTLAFNDTTGLGVSFDAGHDTATVTGAAAAIDAALLKGLVYTPSSDFIGDDTLTVTANDQGHNSSGIAQSNTQTLDISVTQPLAIATDHFTVTHNSTDGTTSITGLSVLDADASPTETFTIGAITSGTGSSTVTPALSSPDSGSLTHINGDLATNGITYNPGLSPSPIDNVKVTVTDSFGATDTVNFIFNVAQNPSQPVTLTSTTGKDVMFGTGYQDQFVFAANSNNDQIMNFTPGQDHIDLTALSATVNASNLSTWFASHVVASPATASDTLVTLDAADTILLHNVTVTQLHSSDFIVHA